MTAFLYGNAVAASQAAGAGAWRRPIAFAEYVCTYLGGAIMQFSEPAAMYLGALALLAAMALVAWAMTRRDALLREAAAPYAAWIVFGAAAAVATAIERLDQGRCQALSSRYISFSNLFYIGLFMTAWLAACRRNAPRKARKWAYPIAIWMFAALIGANAAYGLLCADERHDAFAPAAQAFREGRDRNLWGRLFPRVEEMPRYRQILLDRRWSIFREAPP